MKKYIPIDFDEKGKVILGNAKNTPTPNGTIPAIFIPGGSDENKQGLKSISISPAIQTTPALDSLFPIYYDDLTEQEKQRGAINRGTTANVGIPAGEYTVTFTPTSDWYAADTDTFVFGEKGQPVTTSVSVDGEQRLETSVVVSNGKTQETSTEYFTLTFIVGLPS